MTQLDLFSISAKAVIIEEQSSNEQLSAVVKKTKGELKTNKKMGQVEEQNFNAVEKAFTKNLQRKLPDAPEPQNRLTTQDKETINNNIVFEDNNITVKIKNKGALHGGKDNGTGAQAKPEPRKSIVTRQPKTEYSIALNEKLNSVKNNIKEGLLNDAAEKKKQKKETKVVQKRGRKSLKELDVETDLISIPADEVLFAKQYYSIREVAGWFNVNTSLLRFWENEFDILTPRKNRKGDRLFRPEDVKNLQLIYQLLRQRKFSIEGAKEFLKSNRTQAETQFQLSSTLTKFRNFLLELKASIQ